MSSAATCMSRPPATTMQDDMLRAARTLTSHASCAGHLLLCKGVPICSKKIYALPNAASAKAPVQAAYHSEDDQEGHGNDDQQPPEAAASLLFLLLAACLSIGHSPLLRVSADCCW